MQDLELYSEKVIIEPEFSRQSKVILIGVDLSEITGQVNIDELLNNYDYADIADYLERRKAEDEE